MPEEAVFLYSTKVFFNECFIPGSENVCAAGGSGSKELKFDSWMFVKEKSQIEKKTTATGSFIFPSS